MAKYSTRKYTSNDVKKLIEAGHALYLPKPSIEDIRADWLLEGRLGSHLWKTQNAGHDHLENDVWKGTININFAHRLPNGSLLTDPENVLVLHALQKWAFALRSGQLGYNPGPVHWQTSVRWALNFTSWTYLRSDDLHPLQFGYELIDIEDIKELLYQLSLDSWAEALEITRRLYISLYEFTYGRKPTERELANLPYVDTNTIKTIRNKLRAEELFKIHTKEPESLICRAFLGKLINHTNGGFRSVKVRAFLRQFEMGLADETLLLRGKILTNYPNVKSHLLDEVEAKQVPEHTMAMHALSFDHFLSGHLLNKSHIPHIEKKATEILKEICENISTSKHQRLIPVNDGLAILSEAARWIVNFGDQLIKIYTSHLESCKAIDKRLAGAGYAIISAEKAESLNKLILNYNSDLKADSNSPSLIEFAGLSSAFKRNNRDIQHGNLTLSQAVYVLIGACTYAIGMMKPMREGEMESIPYNCVLRNNLNNGCWIKVPNEKSAEQGYHEVVSRPIPYLTYKAVFLLQKLGKLTATIFFGADALPTRLFYFASGNDGMSPPIERTTSGTVGVALCRCMDYFCDYLNLALDEHGRRQYYRIHELRKFFLLTLSWDEPYHGEECAAWMAAHRSTDYLRAYTDANIDGAELSDLEAQYIESRIIEVEASGGTNPDTLTTATYQKILKELKVDSISVLAPEKFSSYVRNAVGSGHLSAKLIKLRSIVPGDANYTDLAVIIGKDK